MNFNSNSRRFSAPAARFDFCFCTREPEFDLFRPNFRFRFSVHFCSLDEVGINASSNYESRAIISGFLCVCLCVFPFLARPENFIMMNGVYLYIWYIFIGAFETTHSGYKYIPNRHVFVCVKRKA